MPQKLPIKRSLPPPDDQPETASKVTVNLFDRQVAYLDSLAVEIRLKHRYAISRAEIIRALIDAAQASGVDLTAASDASSVFTMMKAAWSR